MDVNSRINWKSGMEVTVQTLTGMNRHIDFQQQVAIQAALGNLRLGLLPGVPFKQDGVFVKNAFEIAHFRCMALLPSGRIIDADETVSVSVQKLSAGRYYLTVGFGDETTEFEKEGVAYVRPQYVYTIMTLEETMAHDVMPVACFEVSDGTISIDVDYIPPTLQLVCDARIEALVGKVTERLEAIARHPHLEDGMGKRFILHFLFMVKDYQPRSNTADFIALTQEIVQAIDYYVMTPNEPKPETSPEGETSEPNNVGAAEPADAPPAPLARQYDIIEWLRWTDGHLERATRVLDQVVLADDSIDYDALKAQIMQELHERLAPELNELLEKAKEQLHSELSEQLRSELSEQLMTSLTEHIEQTVKPALHDALSAELFDSLYQKLYDALYNALLDVLSASMVKPEEPELFTPLI